MRIARLEDAALDRSGRSCGITLSEFLRWLRGRRDVRCVGVSRDVTVTGLTDDSRQARPGDLFIAVPGESVDGHRFIEDAVARGAVAVLAERPVRAPVPQLVIERTREAAGEIASYFCGDPSRHLRVVGVTGTNGKTTTAMCLWRIFSEADGATAGLLGTIENVLGADPETGRPVTETPLTTTPGPVYLHKAFRSMVDRGSRSCVMEVSSHALVQKRTAGVSFAAAILTNITSDHLDYHGSLEAYREAKSLLFRSLDRESFAVLNECDSSYGFLRSVTKAVVIPYSLERGWPGVRRCTVFTQGEVSIEIEDAQGGAAVRASLFGKHNAENLMAAIACARAFGIQWPVIEKALREIKPPPGRLEEIPGPGFRIFVDYAHTASALKVALTACRSACPNGRLIVVFGCGGDRDRTKRPLMGRTAYELADIVFVTSDNPRTERPQAIVGEILLGMPKEDPKVRVEIDRAEAIRRALAEAGPGDAVLVAGKGHETYQILGHLRVPFDDREVVRNWLKEAGHACC